MEILSPSLTIVIVAFTFALSFFNFRRRSDRDAKLPPGSFGWPFIGESVEFLFGKPEKFVGERMRKYSPDIFKTKILGEKTAVICGPMGHKFLFSNEEKFFTAFRPHPMQKIFRSYQTKSAPVPVPAPAQAANGKPKTEEAKVIRQPGFLKPEALAGFLGKMESISLGILQAQWDGKNEVNVHPVSKTVTLTIACSFFLGIENPERIARLVNHFDDVTVGMHSIMVNVPGTIFYRAKKAAAAIQKELEAVTREKKAAMATGGPMHDILSHMILATDPNGNHMPENEIAGKIMGILVAGYSTVATTITFLMKFVGENPDVYSKIRTEQMEIARTKSQGEPLQWADMQRMKYTWNVVCETLRLIPPLQGTFREVLTEFTYAGYTVPKGWKVYWTVSTTNKNPAYFKDPEKFDPSRYEEGEAPAPYTYVPFGGGPRLCPGKDYARLAILAFIHNVVKKYKWEVIFPKEKVIGDMMPTPEKGLPIRLRHV